MPEPLLEARGIGTDFEVITEENLAEMQDVLYKPSC